MKNCIIVGAGDFDSSCFNVLPGSLVIAADAGYSYCEDLGITPDIIIGDFDSLGRIPKGRNVIRLPVKKDDTDMVGAVKTALAEGCDTFHIYGGTGGRLDHTIANIQLITGLSKDGKTAFLYGKDFTVTAITDSSIEFPEKHSGIISVFSGGDKARGVYESGLKYPLTDAVLTNTFPLGVSNEFTGSKATVSVRKGTLVIIYGTA